MDSLARRERHSLCDLALLLGPDVDTMCGGWTARDLVTHLLVREGNPLGAAGIVVPALAGLNRHAMDRLAKRPFPDLVARLRDPGLLTPFRIGFVERLGNTVEMLVHHEDLRRAQPEWAPRTLPDADEDELWRSVRTAGKLMIRPAGVPVVAKRSDRDGVTATLRGGESPVTVTGKPSEMLLMLNGRQRVADVEYDGPPEAVEKLRTASLGG